MWEGVAGSQLSHSPSCTFSSGCVIGPGGDDSTLPPPPPPTPPLFSPRSTGTWWTMAWNGSGVGSGRTSSSTASTGRPRLDRRTRRLPRLRGSYGFLSSSASLTFHLFFSFPPHTHPPPSLSSLAPPPAAAAAASSFFPPPYPSGVLLFPLLLWRPRVLAGPSPAHVGAAGRAADQGHLPAPRLRPPRVRAVGQGQVRRQVRAPRSKEEPTPSTRYPALLPRHLLTS